MKNIPDKKELAQVKEVASVESFISQAITSNLPVETMEKLFALRERVMAEQAKGAFIEALADFQGRCPVIKKNKKVLNKDGKTVRYQYASIDSIVDQIKKPLSENNLSYTWDVKNEQGFIIAVVTIKHALGHSTTSEFKVPIDTEGYMTAPQKYASALTFAKRYSLCNALGISTGEEDTDATDVNKEPVAKSEKSKIMFLLKHLGRDTKTKEVIENDVKNLTQLTLEAKNYEEIVGRLQAIVDQRNEDSKV